MQMISSLGLLIAIFSIQISLQRYAEYLEWAKKVSDGVFGGYTEVEVELVGVGDGDLDKIPKRSFR